MGAFVPDAHCMVAAVCSWHECHRWASGEILRRLKRGEKMIVAALSLLEAYAILTQMPPPHRLSPEDAGKLLEANFLGKQKLLTLGEEGHRALLRQAPRAGVGGSRIFDLVVVACMEKAKSVTLLALREMRWSLAFGRGIEIVTPPEGRLE